MKRQGSRGFKEIVRDRQSWPTFGLMGFALTWVFVAPMLKEGLYALLGI